MLIGAQLYNVRSYTQSERDFRRTIRRVAEMGYGVVQLSGTGPIPPEILREACDEYDVKIALTHTNADRILNDPEGVIAEHRILGADYIGIGGMPGRYQSAEWIDCFAQDYTLPAQKIADAGMKLMYHNHNFEFERLPGGQRMLERILEQMPASLMGITLDTYWVQAAGADVCEWIARLADRIPCLHIKDMAVKGFQQCFAPIGEGNLNFPKILSQVAQQGKTEYIFIEQDDSYGENPFACLDRSGQYVRELGYKTKD